MPITTRPDRKDSPTSQQPVQSAGDPYAWIHQKVEFTRIEFLDQSADYFFQKWRQEGGFYNIDSAVENCKDCIAEFSDGNPDRTSMESRLVAYLTEQLSVIEGEKAEQTLHSAIVLAKKVYKNTAKDDTNLSERATNYAILLGHRYDSSQREPDDLNDSIKLAQEAVNASLPASVIRRQGKGALVENPAKAGDILNTLCATLEKRFLITGSLADLTQAISIWSKLIDAVSHRESEGSRPTWLSNLSASLLRKYEQSEHGDREDLTRSIYLSREALRYIGRNDPKRADVSCTLAHSLAQRAVVNNDTESMNKAIKLLWQAHPFSNNSHPLGIEIRFNLAMRLFQRSQMRSNSEEEQVNFKKFAVLVAVWSLKITPEKHPIKPHLHNLIGLCRFYAGLSMPHSGRDSANEITLEHLEKALKNPSYVPVYRRVQAGRLILKLCCQSGRWEKAYEASKAAVRLIPKITSRSIHNSDKQRLLSLDDVVGFSADAAAAALNAGKDGYEALDFLEMGRGLLAASIAELRADLAELRQGDYGKQLAERFVQLRDQLQMSSSQQYQANLDFEKLLDEIRGKQGFENFLGPLRKEDIRDSARDGPVVVLSASEFRGVDAILITSDDVRVLRFAEITMKQLEISSQNLESLELLEWLWDAIVHPIMEALGFSQPPSPGTSFSRIWWIPTGILSRFPLHAAGRHSTSTGTASTDTVMDRVMSSYSPSIKALLRIRRHSYHPAVASETTALLVSMNKTPQRTTLSQPFNETKEVKRLLKDNACNCITLHDDDQPCKTSVLQHLEACQIFHFAGHGREEIFDPSRSALLLHDWQTNPLTVDSILDLNLSDRNCFLAYLSACDTGVVTRSKFYDESIHLVSAYQLAGFRHVIGSLWLVDDFASVQMATETYRIILGAKEFMTDISVCRGLHAAAMKLRDETRHKMIQRATRQESARGRANARKFEATDSSEEESNLEGSDVEQLWIPYVHFGV